ncbi:MAG: hypothetical protein NC930_08385, partial [Candidatus Omnitrophica bacterium]|nr:hypothetical protein [Candidatus Omnitrophota bacterium]
QGQFSDAYEGKEIPAWKKPKPSPESKLEGGEEKKSESPRPQEAVSLPPITPAPGKMILTGAVTLFQKRLVQSGGHLNFFLNSIDVLTLGDELVGIRSKQPVNRSLGYISTAQKMVWRLFATLFMPVVLAVIGTFRVLLRRQEKQNYLKTFAAG